MNLFTLDNKNPKPLFLSREVMILSGVKYLHAAVSCLPDCVSAKLTLPASSSQTHNAHSQETGKSQIPFLPWKEKQKSAAWEAG